MRRQKLLQRSRPPRTKPSNVVGVKAILIALAVVASVAVSARADDATALIATVEHEPPAKTDETVYARYLAEVGAAVNKLAELRDKRATKALVVGMYRTPELLQQFRRALLATGAPARDALVAVLAGKRGDIPDAVAKLLRDTKQAAGARDFYAAVAVGDFHDPATVTVLLGALARPPEPAYVIDDEPGPTQHQAVFDALRKIGAPAAKDKLLALWQSAKTPLMTRVLAISAYPFVARDQAGVKELGAIAADNGADDQLRQEAATAFARLSRSEGDIAILQGLAQKYLDASAKKRTDADGKPKQDADRADAELAKVKANLDKLKQEVVAATKDQRKTAAEIRAVVDRAQAAEDDFKLAKKKHKEAVAPFRQLDAMAVAYKGFARMFQTHIARIAVALRCKDDLGCFAKTLALAPPDAAKPLATYIKDLDQWTVDEKLGLLEATVERALLELGKAGDKAAAYTELLLDHASSEDRLIRQSILLALPKIAKQPCASCETKLAAAIKAGEGKTALADLQLETQIVRLYFDIKK